ncbi:MAG: protein kinase, partial [Planctomycetota bacterium]
AVFTEPGDYFVGDCVRLTIDGNNIEVHAGEVGTLIIRGNGNVLSAGDVDRLRIEGSVNEVDALVVGPSGVFLVEIKSHPGEVTGDDRTLRIRGGDGARAVIDHPLYLTNLKAKRLKGRLERTPTGAKSPLPRIEAVVFFSKGFALQVPAPANTCLFLQDRPATESQPARDGILAALIHRRGPGLRPDLPARIDKPVAKVLTRALEELGLSAIPGKQRVGDYEVVELIEETALWRDQLAKHVSTPTFRRLRRYFAETGSSLGREAVTRATQREFQLLERLHHRDILAVKDFTTDEQGPVLFFEHLPDAQRLDRFLDEHGERLPLEARLNLLRRIAEAVRYAHANQIVHRGLSPHSVLVVAKDGDIAALRVMNWSAGAHGPNGTTSQPILSPTQHPESHAELAASVYLAPELRQDPASTEPTLDIFSLGTLAWRLITGRPPATSSDELLERARAGGLRLSSSIEGTSQALESLVARATDANVQHRLQTTEAFLEALDEVFESETATDDLCLVPPDAVPGSRLENGLLVKRRLGSGSTAVAFLVERTEATGPETYVLKVARDPDQSKRIAAEAAVLRQLDHPHIARLIDEVELGAYRGFLTKPANDQTLRQRLQSEGQLQLEMLERFGDQLLDALVHLEERGINHRDLKPDNIAVTDFGRRQALGLVLFDFSLSGAPPEDLQVGTLKYSDPFLAERKGKRWDLHAERFSAALTLYEMATGTLPSWGDAISVPLATDAKEITLEPERLPAGLRDALVAFFRKALARRSEDRFDNAAAMRDAWRELFHGTEHSPVVEAPEDALAVLTERTRGLGVRTPLHELPFSTRASNTLDRLSLFTVEELLRVPPIRLLQTRGVGAKTRGELDEVTRALRRLFPNVEISAEPKPATDAESPSPAVADLSRATVDELYLAVRPGKSRKKVHHAAFEALLGTSVALSVRTQVEVAQALGLTPQQLQPTLSLLRKDWQTSFVGPVLAEELAAILERHHGVLSFH